MVCNLVLCVSLFQDTSLKITVDSLTLNSWLAVLHISSLEQSLLCVFSRRHTVAFLCVGTLDTLKHSHYPREAISKGDYLREFTNKTCNIKMQKKKRESIVYSEMVEMGQNNNSFNS
jgi:hypothetical protein